MKYFMILAVLFVGFGASAQVIDASEIKGIYKFIETEKPKFHVTFRDRLNEYKWPMYGHVFVDNKERHKIFDAIESWQINENSDLTLLSSPTTSKNVDDQIAAITRAEILLSDLHSYYIDLHGADFSVFDYANRAFAIQESLDRYRFNASR